MYSLHSRRTLFIDINCCWHRNMLTSIQANVHIPNVRFIEMVANNFPLIRTSSTSSCESEYVHAGVKNGFPVYFKHFEEEWSKARRKQCKQAREWKKKLLYSAQIQLFCIHFIYRFTIEFHLRTFVDQRQKEHTPSDKWESPTHAKREANEKTKTQQNNTIHFQLSNKRTSCKEQQ